MSKEKTLQATTQYEELYDALVAVLVNSDFSTQQRVQVLSHLSLNLMVNNLNVEECKPGTVLAGRSQCQRVSIKLAIDDCEVNMTKTYVPPREES